MRRLRGAGRDPGQLVFPVRVEPCKRDHGHLVRSRSRRRECVGRYQHLRRGAGADWPTRPIGHRAQNRRKPTGTSPSVSVVDPPRFVRIHQFGVPAVSATGAQVMRRGCLGCRVLIDVGVSFGLFTGRYSANDWSSQQPLPRRANSQSRGLPSNCPQPAAVDKIG